MNSAENPRLKQRLAGISPTFTTAQARQALHELIDDIPAAVHIAVPRGTGRPTISYPPMVVAQYAARTFALGIERFEAAPGETVRSLVAGHTGSRRPAWAGARVRRRGRRRGRRGPASRG